jgi:ferredoxin-NADP reductase/predicted pyridoxine 5'-phosphate oxidase superfamily flavin-nucleotide-binding protein
MKSETVYHEGEVAVQKRAGATHIAQMSAGGLLDRIPASALGFIRAQTMAVLGSVDYDGNLWASVLFGSPGYLASDNGSELWLYRPACFSGQDDPLWSNLSVNPQVGMLLIELSTRRRLRINGVMQRDSEDQYRLVVERAYANCPKYIQRRNVEIAPIDDMPDLPPPLLSNELNALQNDWIESADTFFVASAHPAQGVDASHRGGNPGFVRVLSPNLLRVPDFVGNNMFNTLGNFTSYPHAGLVFPDFEQGRLLQLSGHPRLLWDETDDYDESGGTARFWEFEVRSVRESKLPLQLESTFQDYSPFNPAHRITTEPAVQSLTLEVARSWMETERVKGFELVSSDGGDLPVFTAGAHLPLKVREARGEWSERQYSLLSDPADRSCYRIGVQAEPEGRGGSLYLHRSVTDGESIEARPPQNDFPLINGAAHIILIAGGIGITPMLSMLHTLKTTGRSFELHYSAPRLSDLAFVEEIELLAGVNASLYASREAGQKRLDLSALLRKANADTHFYICGPRRMIVELQRLAHEFGFPARQIHYESFGGFASTQDRSFKVELKRTGVEINVLAGRSILDTLLDAGYAVPHECKRGECGLCVTDVHEGDVEHRDVCLTPEVREQSMCICVSRARSGKLLLDL